MDNKKMKNYKIEYKKKGVYYEFTTIAYNAKDIKDKIEKEYVYKDITQLYIYEISPKTWHRHGRNSWKYDFLNRKWRWY